MPLTTRKTLSFVERLLLVLTLATVLVMAWQHWGMNRSLVITPGSGHKVWAVGDDVEKGSSVAQYRENDTFNMQCQIKHSIQYPYCSLYIQIGPNHEGIDLTNYKDLRLTVKQSGTVRDSISLYLKHLNKETSIAEFANQISVNQLVINPTEIFSEYILPLNRFYVPSWWVYYSHLPYETPGPNLSTINYLIINTGDNNTERDITTSVSRVEFQGKWIEADQLYKYLLVVWICIFGIFYLVLFIKLQLESNEQKATRRELEEINKALDTKRKQLESIAIYDSDTGILNRRGMIDRLQEAFQQMPENETCPITLVSIDNYEMIEGRLKEHCIGELISHIANQLSNIMGYKTTVARWGKNEIMALATPEDAQQIQDMMNQFLKDISEFKFRDSIQPQVSIGIIITPGKPIPAVIELCELALSTAKRAVTKKLHLLTTNVTV